MGGAEGECQLWIGWESKTVDLSNGAVLSDQ